MDAAWIIGVLLSIVTLLLSIIGYFLAKMYDKFDVAVTNLQKVTETMATHSARLDNVDTRISQTDNRLNNHGDRLRLIELKQAKIDV